MLLECRAVPKVQRRQLCWSPGQRLARGCADSTYLGCEFDRCLRLLNGYFVPTVTRLTPIVNWPYEIALEIPEAQTHCAWSRLGFIYVRTKLWKSWGLLNLGNEGELMPKGTVAGEADHS